MPTVSKKLVAWSYSALTQFETCAKRFWHFRIKREYKDEGGPDSWYGQEVHREIAAYLTKGWKLNVDKTHFQPTVDLYKNGKMKFIGAEMQMAINKDFEPTGWFDDDVWLRVVVDAAWVDEASGTALLVDWKTGKMKPDEEATQLMLSACVYMLRDSSIKRCAVRYVWLTVRDKTTQIAKHTSFTLQRDEMPHVWNTLAPRLKRYYHAHDHDEFPANKSGLCKKHCSITSCPHHGG